MKKISKRSFVIAVIIAVLSISTTVFGSVAVSIWTQPEAGMKLFSAHVEKHANPDEASLVVRYGDQTADFADMSEGIREVVFPVNGLDHAQHYENGSLWVDEEGYTSYEANSFFVSSKNGDIENTYCRVDVTGDGIDMAEAMRFGVVVKEPGGATNEGIVQTLTVESIGDGRARSVPIPIGTIHEGEEREVILTFWVNEGYFEESDEYIGNSFSVEVTFMTA